VISERQEEYNTLRVDHIVHILNLPVHLVEREMFKEWVPRLRPRHLNLVERLNICFQLRRALIMACWNV
jgi:hypothetical protein